MSTLINEALIIAAKAHEDQYRKGTNIPYMVHPVEVRYILIENNCSEEVIAAGILHDALEDTDVPREVRCNLLGEYVVALILEASEELDNRSNTPWRERKEHTIQSIENASTEVKMIVCADKLSNIRSMKRDYAEIGDKL